MIEEVPKKRSRGRPATGAAKSSTDRVKASEDALKQSGGYVLRSARLSEEGKAALDALVRRDGTIRAAVERALIDAAKKL